LSINFFGERMEFHATGAEVVEHGYQVSETAVADPEKAVILEHALAPGLLQRRELQSGVLSCRNAGTAVCNSGTTCPARACLGYPIFLRKRL